MNNKRIRTVNINLSELITEEIMGHNVAAMLKRIVVSHSTPTHLFVNAEKDMVKIIFRNLIHNGIKYSLPGQSDRHRVQS